MRKRAISPMANSVRLSLTVLSVSDVETNVFSTLGLILVAEIVLSRTGKAACIEPAAKVICAVLFISVLAPMLPSILHEKVSVAVSAAPRVLLRVRPVASAPDEPPLTPANTGTVQEDELSVLSKTSVTVTSKASAPPIFSKVIL